MLTYALRQTQAWQIYNFGESKLGMRKIVRARGGTAERAVSVCDIVVPELPSLGGDQIAEHWIRSAERLREDVRKVVEDLSAGHSPSIDLFVPNYWKAAIKLPDRESAPILELWHLAHDLGKETMRTDIDRWRVTREGVEGMQYFANL